MSKYIVHKAVELDSLSAKAISAINEQEWIISPKYDGCHAVFCFLQGQPLVTLSRSGESVASMGHIARGLLDVYPWLATSERIAICGEAWALGLEFNEISGMFRRHSKQESLQFVPFDVVPYDFNADTFADPSVLLGQFDGIPYMVPYANRLRSLLITRSHDYTHPRIVEPQYMTIHDSLSEAKHMADEAARVFKQSTTGAYDGTILAQANGLYQVGSGKGGEFIKCKPLLSDTVTVNAIFTATGDKTGKNTLALGFLLAGKKQKVSTGLTQAQVDAFTADPGQIIGQRIEVEAMGLTVNGLLREPRFKGIRTDA
jgi:ATP-dependent DNA ligase